MLDCQLSLADLFTVIIIIKRVFTAVIQKESKRDKGEAGELSLSLGILGVWAFYCRSDTIAPIKQCYHHCDLGSTKGLKADYLNMLTRF